MVYPGVLGGDGEEGLEFECVFESVVGRSNFVSETVVVWKVLQTLSFSEDLQGSTSISFAHVLMSSSTLTRSDDLSSRSRSPYRTFNFPPSSERPFFHRKGTSLPNVDRKILKSTVYLLVFGGPLPPA